MYSGVTAAAIASQATTWAGSFENIVLLVGGLGIALLVANWAIAKLRNR